jgi:hypothetical protein
MKSRPGQGGGADGGRSQIEREEHIAPDPAPQARCAGCGRIRPDLELKGFLGRLALLCAECILCAILDRACRRARP